jgi:hypothetical protein
MSLYSINDPKHWLDRAKEARALAEQMDDPEAKRTMLKNAAARPKSGRTSSRTLAKVKVVVRSGMRAARNQRTQTQFAIADGLNRRR